MTAVADAPAPAATVPGGAVTVPVMAFDTETYLIGPGAIAPKVVCGSFATDGQEPVLVAAVDGLKDALAEVLKAAAGGGLGIVIHNASFDAAATSATWPELLPLWFAAYDAGRVYCTKVREKLLNLSTHGKLDDLVLPGGNTKPISYQLASLVFEYFGEDRSAEKGDESWRLNYHLLDGKPAKDYPPAAAQYAKQDAVDHLRVFRAQEERLRRAAEKGYDAASMATQELQAFTDFGLLLMTARGLLVDPERKRQVEEMLTRELAPDKVALLIKHKILRPAEPARPYANGAKNPDGSPKIKAEVPESVDTKALKERVELVCKTFGEDVKLTPTGAISTDKDVLGRISHRDPVLAQFEHRQSLQKLVTTELPRISGSVVHCPFDVLKETGRTSSYEIKTGKGVNRKPLYPSMNGQNVDPRIRPVFVPRPGFLLFSIDYHAIDLVAFAQVCYWLFGTSVLRDGFNADIDPHAYLGAQLAYALDGPYRAAADRVGASKPIDNFKFFDKLKKAKWQFTDAGLSGHARAHLPPGDLAEAFKGDFPQPPEKGWKGGTFFSHYRTFAKPTGLGYPGGLGPDTFVDFARTPYGVIVTRQQAVELREVWRYTYPEAPRYLQYINDQCLDPTSQGEDEPRYRYTSPLGMVRSRATYCAAANGFGLQTPEAEGMKLAVCRLQRACYDPTIGSPLYGFMFPQIMIHDEIVGEVAYEPGSERETTALLNEAGRIMRDAMQQVLPDVKVKTKPCVMRRWYKEAEQVLDAQGNIVPWAPAQETR